MQHLISCSCGEVLLKSAFDTKVRGIKVLIFREDEAIAVCKSCNKETNLPIKIDMDVIKSLSNNPEPANNMRLYIRDMHKKP